MSYYWPKRRAQLLAVAVLLGFVLLAKCSYGKIPPVDQLARWREAKVRTIDVLRADKAVALYLRTQHRYEAIEKMRANGVPAPVIFCLHYRESDNDFHAHAHNGDPLTHRTRNEPKGRLPGKPAPYTFEESAEDAYYVVDRLDKTNWPNPQSAFDRLEYFNGPGYRYKGIAAPYIWSGCNLYSRGKYVSDGRFDPLAVDKQLGCATIFLRMQARGIKLPFLPEVPSTAP